MERIIPATDDTKRRYTMSRIGSKDTTIEVLLRKALWKSGIRYRKNYSKLPGTPDIAITKYRIAIFCDGEFWHGKDWESKKMRIKSNRDYWISKIERNIDRDNEVNQRLCINGWTVLRFWGNQILDDLTGCVEDVKEIIFQSELDAYKENWAVCDLYPCWLMEVGNELSPNEAAQRQFVYECLPCFHVFTEAQDPEN